MAETNDPYAAALQEVFAAKGRRALKRAIVKDPIGFMREMRGVPGETATAAAPAGNRELTEAELDAMLASDRAAVLVVTRPERIVISETRRLIDAVGARGTKIAAVVANYVTPENDCPCDQSMRAHELAMLGDLQPTLVIERREHAPASGEELLSLVPLQLRDDV